MALRNTSLNYGAIAKWLHWSRHAGAALYHHFVLKDRTLIKMSGWPERAPQDVVARAD